MRTTIEIENAKVAIDTLGWKALFACLEQGMLAFFQEFAKQERCILDKFVNVGKAMRNRQDLRACCDIRDNLSVLLMRTTIHTLAFNLNFLTVVVSHCVAKLGIIGTALRAKLAACFGGQQGVRWNASVLALEPEVSHRAFGSVRSSSRRSPALH